MVIEVELVLLCNMSLPVPRIMYCLSRDAAAGV